MQKGDVRMETVLVCHNGPIETEDFLSRKLVGRDIVMHDYGGPNDLPGYQIRGELRSITISDQVFFIEISNPKIRYQDKKAVYDFHEWSNYDGETSFVFGMMLGTNEYDEEIKPIWEQGVNEETGFILFTDSFCDFHSVRILEEEKAI